MNHFDEMAALLYLEGQLDPERAREIAAHAAECLSCRELLGALESEGVWLRQSLTADDESVPARLAEAPERGSTPWGWIMALALSASGAYTLWTSVVVPWKSQAAQAGFTQSNLLSMLFFSGAFWKGWDAMRSITEFLAISTLTVVISWLLRRHWRRLTTVAVVLGAVAFALAAASPAGAAETRRGDPNYTLSAGQEIHTDLFVLADRTVIDGDVDGDLAIWSQEVTINGHVKGDVLCGGQMVRINGTVDGNVRILAHDVDINGTVGRNLMTWSNEVNLDNKSSIGGTATFGTNNATLSGNIAGDVLGMGNFIDIGGTLGQNANLRADHLTIHSTANIKGRVKYGSRREADIAQGAKIGSIEKVMPTSKPTYENARYYWHRVLYWGVGFVFGLVLMLLVPEFYADATGECRKYAPAAGFGLLFLFATPIAALIACITIVGLGVGIATFLLYLIAVFASTIFVSGFIGEALLGPKPGTGAAIGRLALGLLILHVLRALPYIGGWVLFITMFWGLGAVILALYKRLRTAAAVPVPA